MKLYQAPRSSFLYYFFKRFILLIIIPVLACWIICAASLDYFYINNSLTSQQVSMENSLSSLDASLIAISNVITALESTKPFMTKELLARLRALGRRSLNTLDVL